MAEGVAAFYAVETALEGAAVGAYAVSQSTTPLHLRFRRTATSPPANFFRSTEGSSLNVVKGKAYIFGGDTTDGGSDVSMKIITLPSNIENGECDYLIKEPDFEPVRPLQQYSTASTRQHDPEGFEKASVTGDTGRDLLQQEMPPRAAHASTSIDQDIFILSGRHPGSGPTDGQLFNCDQIYSYSTQTNKWSIIQTDISKCKQGIPAPRTHASCTSTTHPQPDSAISITLQAHGTIFLHGGYDAQNQPLRDTWAFDISSRTWARWPDVPDPSAEEVAGEGKIICHAKRLWRAGDGFGKMSHIDFDVVQENIVNKTSGPFAAEVGVKPKDTMWTSPSLGEGAGGSGAGPGEKLTSKTQSLPLPRQGAGLLQVNVGSGRTFLLYFMGKDGPSSALGDVWSFQIEAEGKSLAAMKDTVRRTVGKATGENKWAPCEIIESTKKEGELHPPRGLYGFATDTWTDLGAGNVIIWGGKNANDQPQSQCWIMTVE